MTEANAFANALDGLTERQSTNIEIVTSICNGIRDRIIERIKDGTVPADWDGHEMRELVYDNAKRYISRYMGDKRTKRYRSYEAVCLTNGSLR